jgi:hypothetical protein
MRREIATRILAIHYLGLAQRRDSPRSCKGKDQSPPKISFSEVIFWQHVAIRTHDFLLVNT